MERARRRQPDEDDFDGLDGDDEIGARVPTQRVKHVHVRVPTTALEPPEPIPESAVDPRDLALVTGLAPGRARVRDVAVGETEEFDADLDAALARTQRASVAVGDRVVLERRVGGRPRVVGVVERRSTIARADGTRAGAERVVAANVDRALVVAAAREPRLRPRLVDRYLIALEAGGVRPIVCVSKVDLVETAAERAEIEAILDEFRALEVPALCVSVESGEGLDDLRALVRGRTSVLVGQSGVGKSSLANGLFGALDLVTGRVRDGDGKGRHTTTASSLFEVDDAGTRLIDTPGVRSFGLVDVTRDSLESYFPDFDAARASCRFGDCSHVDEPNCGVRAAVESGDVPARRYEAYVRIRASLDG
jgi:ribosome biogenesis GTPase / thiamine phosphate phosphatase